MGCYDFIEGKVICPYCNKPTTFICQIKWLNYADRSFHTYRVGNRIYCADAIYTGGSTVRKSLDCVCDNCDRIYSATATVKDGKLKSIDPIQLEDKNETV